MVTFKKLEDSISIVQLKGINTCQKHLIDRFIESIEEQAEYSNVIGMFDGNKLCGAVMVSDLDYYDFGDTVYSDSSEYANYKLDGIVLDTSKNTVGILLKALNYAIKEKLSSDSGYIGNKKAYLFADKSSSKADLLRKALFSQVKLLEETLYVKKIK